MAIKTEKPETIQRNRREPTEGTNLLQNGMMGSHSGHSYEEFFGGTIACPSCRGSGRIPRGELIN